MHFTRDLVFVAVVIGVLWVFDVFAIDGRCSQAFWQEASYQGQKFRAEVRRWEGGAFDRRR
jgi:hypothetical protein